MNRGVIIITTIIATVGLSAGWFWITGLPLRRVPSPTSGIVGAISDTASDPTRKEFFAETGRRVVPFQILYPASRAGHTVG